MEPTLHAPTPVERGSLNHGRETTEPGKYSQHLICMDSADSFPEARTDPSPPPVPVFELHSLSAGHSVCSQAGSRTGKRKESGGAGALGWGWGDGGAGGKHAQLSEGNTGQARLMAGAAGGGRGRDGWMASPTRCHEFEQAVGVGDG